MRNFLIPLAIVFSFNACIPPGKLNESIERSNKLANSQDKLKSELSDSVKAYKQNEKAYRQRIIQLEDSISHVIKSCADSQTQPDKTTAYSNEPQHVIYFDFDKYNLIDSSFHILSTVVGFLKKNDDYNCVLQGYTDIEGPEEYNLKLSENRVASARNYMLSYGISANRITGSFFGKAFVRIETIDRDANWRNRRVEIFLTRK